MCSSPFLQNAGHVKRNARGLLALDVLTRKRLRFVLYGQDRVGNGHVKVQTDLTDPFARFVGNQFEVIGLASDDASNGDQRMKGLGIFNLSQRLKCG